MTRLWRLGTSHSRLLGRRRVGVRTLISLDIHAAWAATGRGDRWERRFALPADAEPQPFCALGRGGGADARRGAQQVLLLAPQRAGLHCLTQLAIAVSSSGLVPPGA